MSFSVGDDICFRGPGISRIKGIVTEVWPEFVWAMNTTGDEFAVGVEDLLPTW